MRVTRALAVFLVLVLLAVAGLWNYYLGWLESPMAIDEPTAVEFSKGSSLAGFARDLSSLGLLTRPHLLKIHARFEGGAQHLHAGEYLLEPGLTPRRLYELVRRGRVIEYSVTIIEGWTVQMMRSGLRREQKLIQTLAGVTDMNLLQVLGVGAVNVSPEGRFFPDTYVYRKGTKDSEIMLQAYQRMRSVVQQYWPGRDANLPYQSDYEALVMASLVEKETGMEDERGRIAGVFVRRLQRGMKLQTDPSVIYGLGEGFNGNLTRAQLRLPGPYNTYLERGLPPTPIALPGAAAIEAALHPAPDTALFFVARGDGSHEFSDTVAAHNAAVRQYQLGSRRADYRSQPLPKTESEEG